MKCLNNLLSLLVRQAAMIALLAGASEALAFEVNGNKWPGGRTTVYTGMSGTSASGIPWSQALQEAISSWNHSTVFQFQINPTYLDPCRSDRRNGVDFTTDVCGRKYESNTLAVTLLWYEYNSLGVGDITEADVVFNANINYDVYDGYRGGSAFDFRRVALHEFGHVMGLGHELNTSVPAIMSRTIGNIFTPQKDDIDGVNLLYGDSFRCGVTPLRFGSLSGALGAGDCLVKQLMLGGTDDSFVDAYRFVLTEAARVTIGMNSSVLDSVLVLMDNRLTILDIDDDSGGGCNASIRRVLAPGSYIVLANTYTNPTSCGDTRGPYNLTFSYDTSVIRTLSGKDSFKGGSAAAGFRGGVTLNNGFSFTSRVTPYQPFSVRADIQIDPAHQNQPGFLVIAALLDNGEILVKNPAGEFVPYQPELNPIPIAQRKVLGVNESVEVLGATVASQLGIQNIEVDFLVGYGVDSNPDELYFHQEPINLIVGP